MGLTGLKESAASPFVFTESGTPDNFMSMYNPEDRRIFDENRKPGKIFI